MSDLTREYADRVAAGFREDDAAGIPFGVAETVTHGGHCGFEVALDRENQSAHCAECDDELELDECEGVLSAWDYLEDVLDWRYTIDRDGTYRSAEIAISLGGPNVWIHTGSRELHVHWAFDHEVRNLPSDLCDRLDEALSEYYESAR